MKQNKHKKLSKVIDVEKNLKFRPYTFTPLRVAEIQLCVDLGENIAQ